MNDLEILREIRDSGDRIDYAELINRGKKYPPYNPSEDAKRLEYLRDEAGYIEGPLSPYSFVKITGKGIAYSDSLEKKTKQEAEEKRYRRFDNKVKIASALISVISFIAGLIIEHFSGVISFFQTLFT